MDAAEVKGEILELSEDQFFNLDEELRERLEDEGSDLEFQGLAISAPELIDVKGRSALPLVMLCNQTGRRAATSPFEKNCKIVLVDLGGRRIHTDRAFVDDKAARGRRVIEDEPVDPESMDELNAGALLARIGSIDLRHRLDLPWTESRMVARLVHLDWVSNPVEIELFDPEKLDEEPEEKEPEGSFPRSAASELSCFAQPPDDPEALPRFLASDAHPQAPEPGVALSIPSTWSLESERLPFLGTLRVALSSEDVVEAAEDGAEEEEPVPGAVLSCAVMLVKNNVPLPNRLDVDVPVFSETGFKPGDLATACFTVDAKKRAELPLEKGIYHVYLVAGRFLDGPHKLEVTG